MANQNRAQNEDEIEYVEMEPVPPTPDPALGIYFSPSDLNRSNSPNSNVVTKQASEDAVYDLPGSSAVYKMKTRRQVSQNNQCKQSEQNVGWTMAEKMHITMTAIIMAISVSALAISVLGLFDGKT